MKNIAKGLMVFSFLALLVAGSPASAENNKNDEKGYLNARAGLKAEALVKLESATGAVLGPNGTIRVLGAKVVSVSENVMKAVVSFGESMLNFVVNIDANTKINGNGDAKVGDLKAGDKVSFSGTVTSSTSSAITVDVDHLVSRALFAGTTESEDAGDDNDDEGDEDDGDEDEDKDEKENKGKGGWLLRLRSWFLNREDSLND